MHAVAWGGRSGYSCRCHLIGPELGGTSAERLCAANGGDAAALYGECRGKSLGVSPGICRQHQTGFGDSNSGMKPAEMDGGWENAPNLILGSCRQRSLVGYERPQSRSMRFAVARRLDTRTTQSNVEDLSQRIRTDARERVRGQAVSEARARWQNQGRGIPESVHASAPVPT